MTEHGRDREKNTCTFCDTQTDNYINSIVFIIDAGIILDAFFAVVAAMHFI